MAQIEDLEIELKALDKSVFAISLVERPAVQSDVVLLSAHDVQFKVVDKEKRLIAGAVLIPEKRIYRKVDLENGKTKEFNMYFKAHTVEAISQKWMEDMEIQNVTLQHNEFVTGVNPVESWIVQDYTCDKAKLLNLDVVDGTWCVIMKVHDDKLWQEAKDGKIKGYSIEAAFQDYVDYLMLSETPELSEDEILLKKIKNILSADI